MSRPASRRRRTPDSRRPAPESPGRRRGLWLAAGLTAIAAIAAGGWWWLRPPAFAIAQRSDQNVLLVTIDTLRADALGSYGGAAATPNLDRLAAEGARFSFAHAHAVVTLPSHASILTGRYPYEHGIRDNAGYRLGAREPTIATRLSSLGFATGAFVGGFTLDQRFGLARGFGVYDDLVGELVSSGQIALPERRADAVVASALDWMKRQQGKWLAWVHVFDPHAPYRAPAEWQARIADPYLAEVSWTDFALGPLFDQLRSGSRPTLIVVTADHGESRGEHGEATHSLFAYEATLRVPLIVAEIDPARPGRGARGVVSDAPVRHVDILPTVLDAIGAPADAALPGASIRGVLTSGADAVRPSYFEAMTANLTRGWAPLRGVLVGRRKYVDLPIPELYDIASDPGESRNLVPVQRDQAAVMFNTLRGFSVDPPGRPQDETAAVREQLRSLGYIGGGASARDRYTEDDDPKRLIGLEQKMRQAADAVEARRFGDAEALYLEVIASRPDMEDAYRYLAYIYWEGGRPADAIATLERALGRGMAQLEIRVKLAQYLAESGRPARAIQLLDGATGDDPDALNALGMAYGMAQQPAEAMRTFRHVIEIDPSSGLAWQNIATLQVQARDYAGAEASARRAMQIDPKLPGAHTTLGVALSRTGRRIDAIEAWKQAVALDPSEFDALYNLTVELVAAGRIAEARTYGERYLATAPAALYQKDIAHISRLIGGAPR